MNYRNLEYIYETQEFRDLVSTYQLNYDFFDNVLFIWNDHIILNIHGFVIEQIYYIEFFSKNFELFASPSELLGPEGLEKRREKYEEEKKLRTEVVGVNENGNKNVLLKAESFLFFYLKILKQELGDYFNGAKKMNITQHRPIESHQLKRLKAFFDK